METDVIALNMKIENCIERMLIDGYSIKGGNNGPYYDKETPVRNMSHLLVIASEYYAHKKEPGYLGVVKKIADAIVSSEFCSQYNVYKCRDADGKDMVNGTIGAAWIIEGLVAAYDATRDDKYLSHAFDIFNALKFDEKYKLWHRADLDGSKMSIDATFNHQLWFAMAGALLVSRRKNEKVHAEVKCFLDGLLLNLKTHRNGLICHSTRSDKYGVKTALLFWGRDVYDRIKGQLKLPSKIYKEQGYHAFNVYAFAKIYDNGFGEHSFFKTDKFKKILDYTFSEELYNQLSKCSKKSDGTHVKSKINADFNVFSYSYNSPAFELPYINMIFDVGNKAICDKYLEKQFEYTYDEVQGGFCKNTDDPETLNVRLYEYIYKNEEFWLA